MTRDKPHQTHKYVKKESIIYAYLNNEDYDLSIDEYYSLYSFFVTYSMGNNQSLKGKTLKDYSLNADNLKEQTSDFFNMENENFIFSKEKG